MTDKDVEAQMNAFAEKFELNNRHHIRLGFQEGHAAGLSEVCGEKELEIYERYQSERARSQKLVEALKKMKSWKQGPCGQSCACLDRTRVYVDDALKLIGRGESDIPHRT